MTKQIVAKQGDTAPDVVATLSNAAGPQNLTGATVQWRLKLKDGTGSVITGACSIDTPASAGVVRHPLATVDTAAPGTYVVEYFVTWADNTTTTFPKDYANTLKVSARGTV